MPNSCTGFMNIRGYAPNVDEYVAILQANYSYYKDSANHDYTHYVDPKNFSHIPHFFRVFSAYEFDTVWSSGICKCVAIDFDVAWSVYCCMFPGKHTYYNDFENEYHGNHYGSNILIESKRLQLEIEIWSYEPVCAFQEHYKICSGILVKDESFEFHNIWLEDFSNYKEFKNKYPDNSLTKQEFEQRIASKDYYYEYGLHEEEVDFLPGDNPEYLAHLVMVKLREENK